MATPQERLAELLQLRDALLVVVERLADAIAAAVREVAEAEEEDR